MRVKIGNTWHDSEHEPICIEASPVERQQIHDNPGTQYASAPDDWFDSMDDFRAWMAAPSLPVEVNKALERAVIEAFKKVAAETIAEALRRVSND